FRYYLTCICLLFVVPAAFADNAWENTSGWWNQSDLAPFDKTRLVKQLPLIKVQGNKFVDENGKVMVFRGLNIADPDKIARDKQLTKRHFEVHKSWGANGGRVPVHPSALRKHGKQSHVEWYATNVIQDHEFGVTVHRVCTFVG